MKSHKMNNGGYIALVSVLIAGGLLVLIGVGTTLRGIDASNAIVGEESSWRASLLADACAEEAIMKLKANLAYSGNETIIVGGATACRILAVSGNGNADRVVLAEGSERGYVARVRVELASINPSPVVRTWENIP